MLPKAASRPIRIDDVQYRWLISEAKRLLVIERADGLGGRLEVALSQEIEGMYWVLLETTRDCGPITPKIVRQAVSEARTLGWKPEQDSRTVRLPRR